MSPPWSPGNREIVTAKLKAAASQPEDARKLWGKLTKAGLVEHIGDVFDGSVESADLLATVAAYAAPCASSTEQDVLLRASASIAKDLLTKALHDRRFAHHFLLALVSWCFFARKFWKAPLRWAAPLVAEKPWSLPEWQTHKIMRARAMVLKPLLEQELLEDSSPGLDTLFATCCTSLLETPQCPRGKQSRPSSRDFRIFLKHDVQENVEDYCFVANIQLIGALLHRRSAPPDLLSTNIPTLNTAALRRAEQFVQSPAFLHTLSLLQQDTSPETSKARADVMTVLSGIGYHPVTLDIDVVDGVFEHLAMVLKAAASDSRHDALSGPAADVISALAYQRPNIQRLARQQNLPKLLLEQLHRHVRSDEPSDIIAVKLLRALLGTVYGNSESCSWIVKHHQFPEIISGVAKICLRSPQLLQRVTSISASFLYSLPRNKPQEFKNAFLLLSTRCFGRAAKHAISENSLQHVVVDAKHPPLWPLWPTQGLLPTIWSSALHQCKKSADVFKELPEVVEAIWLRSPRPDGVSSLSPKAAYLCDTLCSTGLAAPAIEHLLFSDVSDWLDREAISTKTASLLQSALTPALASNAELKSCLEKIFIPPCASALFASHVEGFVEVPGDDSLSAVDELVSAVVEPLQQMEHDASLAEEDDDADDDDDDDDDDGGDSFSIGWWREEPSDTASALYQAGKAGPGSWVSIDAVPGVRLWYHERLGGAGGTKNVNDDDIAAFRSALSQSNTNHRLWFHGCHFQRAAEYIDKGIPARLTSGDQDVGDEPAFYCFPDFEDALRHALMRRGDLMMASLPAAAVLIFDIPDEVLEALRPHSAFTTLESFTGAVLASRLSSRLGSVQPQHVAPSLDVLSTFMPDRVDRQHPHPLRQACANIVPELNALAWSCTWLGRHTGKSWRHDTIRRTCVEGPPLQSHLAANPTQLEQDVHALRFQTPCDRHDACRFKLQLILRDARFLADELLQNHLLGIFLLE